MEEMLISAVMPIMSVYRLPQGQYEYSGHVVNLPQASFVPLNRISLSSGTDKDIHWVFPATKLPRVCWKVTLNDVLCNVRCTCEPRVAIFSGKNNSQGPYNQSQCLSEYTSVLLGGWGRGFTVLRLRWTSPIPI